MLKYIVLSILLIGGFSLSFISDEDALLSPDASGALCIRLEHMDESLILPPVDSNLIFPPSSACFGCHSFDPNGLAMVNANGEDVSFQTDWEATMMANSAKDPYWKAKVAHETYLHPEHKDNIETTCTSCHAPMGHYTAILRGAAHYGMEDLMQDTIGQMGVSCGACHMIAEEGLGSLLGGQLNIDTNRVVYGPFEMPFAAPMQSFVGFEPLYSEHVSNSALCASCHTLIIESLDAEGELTGHYYFEQTTYHEWLNSSYNLSGQSCQSCHLPELEEPVVVSANYIFLDPRAGYSQHTLVGGNVHMLEMMKAYKDTLGITASDENYDKTISSTLELLQQKSVDLAVEYTGNIEDTLEFEVIIENKAGHKFPSGFPSRRAFVEFVLTDTQTGDTLFHSGAFNEEYELTQYDPSFEPHHHAITTEEQVQVYEVVPADINGVFTTILERGYQTLKDNRLPPLGFQVQHNVYDTVAIFGMANLDTDFNFDENGVEGSGSDVVKYRIKVGTYLGNVQASAKMHYQSVSPRWVNPLFEDDEIPAIQHFKSMYDASDLTPILVASMETDTLLIDVINGVNNISKPIEILVYPNPVGADGRIYISTEEKLKHIWVYNTWGQMIPILNQTDSYIDLPTFADGLLFIGFETEDGRTGTQKIFK